MCRYRMLIDSRFKLCVYGGTGQGILLDLEEDLQERRNLWDEKAYAGVRGDMLARIADRLAWTDRLDVNRYCGA